MNLLTWHVHGSYLLYLTQLPHEFYLPLTPSRANGYAGRCGTNPWGANVHEVPVEEVRRLALDCILYQSRGHYFNDQYELLSESQRRLPRVYIEHDPPQSHPTSTVHPVQDANTLLVHVTPFNALMWDSGKTPTRVIEHGVMIPEKIRYTGELAKGLAVINHLEKRGRRLGSDIFGRAREAVPLDLVGMDSERSGGLGEVPLKDLPAFEARFRFFFNPIRYTSLGLAVCEAMMVGLPIVGLATTEMATVIQNGISGFIDTRLEPLVDHMNRLLQNPKEARHLGDGARRAARERFNIRRFVDDWQEALRWVVGRSTDAAFAVAL